MVLIDQAFYQKWTVVPLNIVLYNVFSETEAGPDIYGTEPWYFYFLNGFLNFNVAFLAALASLPTLLFSYAMTRAKWISLKRKLKVSTLAIAIKLSFFYLWFLIFTFQAHKEERFLYVIYPLLCFNSAIALFIGQEVLKALSQRWSRPVRIFERAILILPDIFTAYCAVFFICIFTALCVFIYFEISCAILFLPCTHGHLYSFSQYDG